MESPVQRPEAGPRPKFSSAARGGGEIRDALPASDGGISVGGGDGGILL